MPYDLLGAEDILAGLSEEHGHYRVSGSDEAGLDVLGLNVFGQGLDGMGTMLSGADADLEHLLAGADASLSLSATASPAVTANANAAQQLAVQAATTANPATANAAANLAKTAAAAAPPAAAAAATSLANTASQLAQHAQTTGSPVVAKAAATLAHAAAATAKASAPAAAANAAKALSTVTTALAKHAATTKSPASAQAATHVAKAAVQHAHVAKVTSHPVHAAKAAAHATKAVKHAKAAHAACNGQAAAKHYLAAQHMKKQAALKSATRDLAMRNAQAVVPRDYTRGRKLVIGVGTDPNDLPTVANPAGGPTMVAAHTPKTFQVQPQIPFKPDRFWSASAIAPNFVITDIKVGQQSMFAASSAVPAQMFAENSVDSPVNFDTAQISQQLIVAVTNISNASSAFFGSFRGYSAL
jgi:hypothetical protein